MTIVSSIQAADPLVRRLTLTNFLMQSGNQAAYFVGLIGTATYVLGVDAFGVAVLVGVVNLMYILGSGAVGVVVDRFGPRVVLSRLLATYAVVSIVALMLPLSYPLLVCMAGVMAALTGSCSTTISTFPPYLVEGTDALKDANSLVDTAVHLAIIAGPAAGGIISGTFSSTAVFPFTCACMTLAALSASTLEERHVPEGRDAAGEGAEATAGPVADFVEGVRITFHSRALRLLLVMGFMGFFAYGAYDSLESLFYRDVLAVGVEWMGYLSMMSGVGSVFGSMVLLRIPSERVTMRLLAAMLLLTGVGSMIYVGTNVLWIAAVGQALTGFGFGLMMPVQHLLVQEYCDLAYLGRVTGVMRIGLNSSGVIPLVVSPFLARVFGVQGVLFGASAFVAAVGLLFSIRTRMQQE